MSGKSKTGPSSEAEQRLRAGSQRGAQVIKERFATELTRRRLCEELGIHPQTLKKWEAVGVISPQMRSIGGVPTAVFRDTDLVLGKGVLRLLRANPGTMSLKAAAEHMRQGSS